MAGVTDPIPKGPRRSWGRLAAFAPRTGRATARRLPAGLSLIAAIVALLAALGVGGIFLEPAGAVLPIDPSSIDPVDAMTSAVALLALSVGLARGKQLAWYLAIAAFGSAMILQLVVLGHTIAGTVAAICLAALVVDRFRYRARTDRSIVALVGLALGLGAALVVAEAVLVDLVSGQAKAVIDALAGWFAFTDPGGANASTHASIAIDALALATRVLLAVALIAMLRAVADRRKDPVERARAMEVGRLHGSGALVPYQFGEGTEPFLGPDGNGLVVYGRAGRTAVVLGDPIGPAASAQAALLAFIERCSRNDDIPTVYEASEVSRIPLVAAGLHPFRVGQEAIIDLAGFGLEGSRRANLRHTVTRARRGGVSVRWFPAGLPGDELARCGPGLVEIDRAWQEGAGPELAFTIGRFSLGDLAEVAVAVALGPAGEPIAFATFRPTDASGGWVLDLIRRRPGSTPGALESCIVEAALGLRAAGESTLSLGLAPLAGLDLHSPVGAERLLAIGARLVKRWYDVEGLAFFKRKFDPRWEPRYGAVQRPWHLIGFGMALLRLHLAGPGGSLLVAGRAAVAAAFAPTSRR
jgi:phosphatidylglycerol lysyltransferase